MTFLAKPLLLALSFSLCALSLRANESFDVWINQFADDWIRLDPIAVTSSQYFTGDEQDRLDRLLTAKDFQYGTPFDPVEQAKRDAAARAGLAQLQGYEPSNLTPVQRVSRAMLLTKLNHVLQLSELTDHRFVFDQFRGLQVGLINFLSQTHPIRHPRDVENYLVRLDQLAPLLDQGVNEAKARGARGLLPPKFILRSTLDGIDRFLAPEPAQNVLVTSLDERAGKIETISAESRATSLAAAEKLVRDEVRPAFERVRALLTAQLDRASDDAGLWRLPRGQEAYAVALAVNTTTNLTPDQIHEIGLQEVARIKTEMDGFLRQLGYTEGTVEERYKKLEADSQPPADPDPRPGLIALFEEQLRDAERRAELVFDLRPKAPVVVKREPPFTEKSAAAHYNSPAPDGTRPGIFWAPLPGPTYNVISVRTLVYHEGVPGHHFQVALQQELPEIPKYRQRRTFGGVAAFVEGWALYAEQLAVELGWYEGDLKGRLGQLEKELFRARRLVVDTGLHAKKWTRQQAIDYGITASEVERYVVMPGQACAYKLGMLKVLDVRAKAQRELGSNFSLKEFHNVVLRTGEVPLDVLVEVIDGWIVQQKNAS